MKHSFGSDNHSGIHPQILDSIKRINTEFVPAYGEDSYTKDAQELFKDIFGKEASAFFVFNGTGANVLCLKTLANPHNSIICAQSAHINVDECGAPERFTGCKIVSVPTLDGKLHPQDVLRELTVFGNQHHSQPKVISIAQPTELGTLYTIEELKELSDLAHKHNMFLHMDGSRLANASAATGISFKIYTADAGVDALSFGGTKNGMLLGEAVVLFRPELARDFLYTRKQAMQLFSKGRFIAGQYLAYFQDQLWKTLATNANHMAAYMAGQLKDISEIKITHKVETNAVFAIVPPAICAKLLEKHLFYIWNQELSQVRWMCSFNTTKEDVDLFVEDLKKLIS